MDTYRVHRSSNRQSRTSTKKPPIKGRNTGPMSSPVTGARSQGQALRAPASISEDTTPPYTMGLPEPLYAGYAAGGLEGVRNVAQDLGTDWYALPEWRRRQILDSARAPFD
jgi:hypothetical protein